MKDEKCHEDNVKENSLKLIQIPTKKKTADFASIHTATFYLCTFVKNTAFYVKIKFFFRTNESNNNNNKNI